MKNLCFYSACFVGFLATIYATGPVNSGCLEKEKALALLETAENLLTKAGVSFPSCKEDVKLKDESECGGKKSLAYIEISKNLISDVRKNFPRCSKPIEKDDKIVEEDKFSDCSEILESGRNKSGVYTIWSEEPFTTGKSLKVYCDMETDNGGWTMIQRRGKFPIQEDFFRDWESYKNGFGNMTQEFWLGNENIRVLCEGGCKIRFDLQDKDGEKRYEVYKNFSLSTDYYGLNIKGGEGTAGDTMQYHDGQKFSTKDKGNKIEEANSYKGGWWYESPIVSNLNGVYAPGKIGLDTVYWYSFRSQENLASVEIKIRPN